MTTTPCGHLAPEVGMPAGYIEVACNRIPHPDGNHRNIRASDFTVVAEWTHDGAWIRKPPERKDAKRRVRL